MTTRGSPSRSSTTWDRGSVPAATPLSRAQVETLAETEHARWSLERLAAGWRQADQKSLADKTSPHLVPWADLTEEAREIDRRPVRAIPEYLAAVGLAIRRPGAGRLPARGGRARAAKHCAGPPA